MISIARKQRDNRLIALLLFIIAVILVYVICFHWFILRHIDYNEEIGDLASQLARFQRIASQKELVESQLKSLQGRRSESNLFLEEGDFNEAAAAMSERLNQMVSTQADESCQIVSRQPVRARVVEKFEKVTVNVRMRCSIEDFTRLIYSLETGVPMIIAEEVTVIKPRARRRADNQAVTDAAPLDVRFNMSGYLRE